MQQQASTSSETITSETELAQKRKKSDYNKQYRFKRKMEMQQQSDIELAKRKKSDYNRQYQLKRKMKMNTHNKIKRVTTTYHSHLFCPFQLYPKFLSCDRSTGSCICLLCVSVIFCRQGHIHHPVFLSQDRNCTCFLIFSYQ